MSKMKDPEKDPHQAAERFMDWSEETVVIVPKIKRQWDEFGKAKKVD